MDLTKVQISELMCKHAERENGLQDLLEIMLEIVFHKVCLKSADFRATLQS